MSGLTTTTNATLLRPTSLWWLKLGVSKKSAHGHVKRVRESQQHADGDVPGAPLDRLDVGQVKIGLLGEPLLSDAPECPDPAHVGRDAFKSLGGAVERHMARLLASAIPNNSR